MTGSFVFLGAAGALVLMLLLLAPWRREALPPAHSAGPPGRTLMKRFLAREDFEFIASLHSPGIQRLFVRERRRLALAWLREMFREARRLLHLHAHLARHSGDVRLAAELRVACEFALFVAVYAILAGLVRWLGPLRARSAMESLDFLVGALDGLCRRMAGSAATLERGAMAA